MKVAPFRFCRFLAVLTGFLFVCGCFIQRLRNRVSTGGYVGCERKQRIAKGLKLAFVKRRNVINLIVKPSC